MVKHTHILPTWHAASQLALLRLPGLVEALRTRHSVTPYVGCELEWYVDQPENEKAICAAYAAVERDAEAHHIRITPIKPEHGKGQYEVGFDACNNPVAMVQAIHDFRALLMEKAAKRGLHILWDAKPFADDYGSALQVHVHLEDAAGTRLFVKKDEYLSPALAACLGGLLDITPEATFIAAPQKDSYNRFVPKFDAPVNICWGGNNRSVTMRIPLKTGSRCHIEYRLAGSDADPASMFGVLLTGILHGLEMHPHPGEQIHGVASDEKYILPKFPADLENAKQVFAGAHVTREWMGEEWFTVVCGL
ncbi:MAG: hypothetical protein MK052_03085 [Alphaproteobacteria bacterium]|nr:hypothetical protein [Alphaproteobacteria bacterium]